MAIFRALDQFVSIGKVVSKDAGGAFVVTREREREREREGLREGRVG